MEAFSSYSGESLGGREGLDPLQLPRGLRLHSEKIAVTLPIPSTIPNLHFHPKVHQIIKSLSGLLSIMQINLLFKSE